MKIEVEEMGRRVGADFSGVFDQRAGEKESRDTGRRTTEPYSKSFIRERNT